MKQKTLKLATRLMALIGATFALGTAVTFSTSCFHDEQVSPPPTIETPAETPKEDRLLPTDEEILAFYEEVDADTSYMNRQSSNTSVVPFDTRQTRLSPSEAPIKINILEDGVQERVKNEFRQAVQDIDDIFDVINPAYNFEIQFEPTEDDIEAPNNIDVSFMTEADKEKQPKADGFWQGNTYLKNEYGTTTSYSIIKVREESTRLIGRSYSILSHEIFHHLGLGDAYLVDDYVTANTIMLGNQDHIRKNDVALLAGKYADYSTPEKMESLKAFIDTYEDSQKWKQEEEEKHRPTTDELKKLLAEKVAPEDISFDIEGKYVFEYQNAFLGQGYKIMDVKRDTFRNCESYNFSFKPSNSKTSKGFIRQDSQSGPYCMRFDNINGIPFDGQYYFKVKDKLYSTFKYNDEWSYTYEGQSASSEAYDTAKTLIDKFRGSDDAELLDYIVKTKYPKLAEIKPDKQLFVKVADAYGLRLFRDDEMFIFNGGYINIAETLVREGSNFVGTGIMWRYAYLNNGIYIQSDTEAKFFYYDKDRVVNMVTLSKDGAVSEAQPYTIQLQSGQKLSDFVLDLEEENE